MYFDKYHLLESSLVRTKGNLKDKMVVDVNTIDGLIEMGYQAPSDIKIDVEGAEGMVLKGASNLLASAGRPQDLFIEFHPEFLPKFGTTYEDEYLRVIENGYSQVAYKERHGQVLCHFTTRI